MSAAESCAQCGASLEAGFLADRGDHDVLAAAEWVAGEPEPKRFLGLNVGLDVRDRRRILVTTYRCTGCGLLASYARTEDAK